MHHNGQLSESSIHVYIDKYCDATNLITLTFSFGEMKKVLQQVVVHPTNRMNMAKSLFQVQTRPAFVDRLEPCRYYAKEGRLRCQAVNLLPKRVRAWGRGRPSEVQGLPVSACVIWIGGSSPLPMFGGLDRHDKPSDQATLTDLCIEKHGWCPTQFVRPAETSVAFSGSGSPPIFIVSYLKTTTWLT